MGNDSALDGQQFAELNAESAGALYQDVITHPNEKMNYWLSHRARGTHTADANASDGTGIKTEYDSMYLVIMPTKLAMTQGSGGSELATQDELVNYISAHGGYDTSEVGSEECRVTYKNDTDGVLILKISSDNKDWHSISNETVGRDYIAKGGLTRFFFVAGSTANNQRPEKTHGNFLDYVGFSQTTPPPIPFSLTVTKTFTGLTIDQVASLASSTTEGNNTTSNENPFTFTVTNEYTQDNVTRHNQALLDAKLQFTVTKNNGTYTFTPTAMQVISGETVDLFDRGDGSSGEATVNGNTVTLTWKFNGQSVASNASDGIFRYDVTESNANVSGMVITSTYQVNGGNTLSGTSASANVRAGDSETYAFSNAYRENTGDDSLITVQKTFSGVTQTTVDKLIHDTSSPYSVNITKTNASNGTAISGTQPTLTLTPTTNGGDTADVSYSENVDSKTGKTILTWVIKAKQAPSSAGDVDMWMGGPGVYSVSEKNYTPTPASDEGDQNSLKTVTINGMQIASPQPDSNGNIALGSIYVGKVGDTDYSPTMTGTGSVSTNLTNGISVPNDTNIIVARASNNSYVVWTKEMAGANLRQAAVDFINSIDGLGKGTGSLAATLNNVSFRSGENPGELKLDSTNTGTTLTYNGGTTVTFNNGTGVTWISAYATKYSLTNYEYQTGGVKTGQVNDDIETRISNSYEPIVRLKKVDSSDSNKTLSGATFRFFKYRTNADNTKTKVYLLKNQVNNKYVWAEEKSVPTSNPIREFPTGEDGIVSMGKMETTGVTSASSTGSITYYIEETDAPAGYNKLTKPLAFVVHSDGTVERWSKDNDGKTFEGTTDDGVAVNNTVAEIDWNSPYYTVTIANSSGSTLPETGGRGTIIFTILGLLLLFGGGTWLYLRRKRSRSSFRLR